MVGAQARLERQLALKQDPTLPGFPAFSSFTSRLPPGSSPYDPSALSFLGRFGSRTEEPSAESKKTRCIKVGTAASREGRAGEEGLLPHPRLVSALQG